MPVVTRMSPVAFMTAVAPAVLGVGLVFIAGICSVVFLAVAPLVTVVVLAARMPAAVLTMRVLSSVARVIRTVGPAVDVLSDTSAVVLGEVFPVAILAHLRAVARGVVSELVVSVRRSITTAGTTVVLGPVLGVAVVRHALVVNVGRGTRLPRPVEGGGFLAALVMPVAQFGGGSVELHIHSSRLDDGDAGPRGRDQRPDPIDNGGEFGAGRAGNGHDVGVGRSIGFRPSAPGDRGLERESGGWVAGHGNDKHVRASLRNPEQPRRHVHRRAPSRHA
ncbi:hypothetical protein FB558_5606 [Pseudonocardia kunmingensis]|uniref:Uncharacterized protein n=1 Tax=Pseudonocardia kunmingensis TaxID=630975 RepID=A0A543DKH6_9PSEU|nr:hypothetical protein FB558_5606 [Pseudonocardia kunmingensis]